MISVFVSPWIKPTRILNRFVIKTTSSNCRIFIPPNPVIKIKAIDPKTESNVPTADLPNTNVVRDVGVRLTALNVLSTFPQ